MRDWTKAAIAGVALATGMHALTAHTATAPAVVLENGEIGPPGLIVDVAREGDLHRPTLKNTTDKPWRIREVRLLDLAHGLTPETRFYGEAFSMFGGTAGTLGKMIDLDGYTDRGHYKLPEPPGMRTVYGMAELTPPKGRSRLFAFASCRRFVGKIHVSPERVQVVVNTENLEIKPGERWDLEELLVAEAEEPHRKRLELAERLNRTHPRLAWPKLPTGWCSWYCFGPGVTPRNVQDNLNAFTAHFPGGVRYIQIDDGYQPWMGDWLEPSERFPEGVQKITRQIAAAGYEAAIWVAPFIASPESRLFREHPDWFVTDSEGKPLRSDKVTFGGWRQGPWYMLDGTHPEAQAYLERVFRTFRRDWGVTYFKLDANLWGSLPFGRRHDPAASSVEAYRRGMAAVRRGAGPDSFILGCNHALWPSLGEIHGSRVSMDVGTSWDSYKLVAGEYLWRNWMNHRLWWNDPDCLLLTRPPSARELSFHMAATYASGGMLLSGDDVTRYTPEQWAWFRLAAANPGVAAVFENERMETGRIEQSDRTLVVLLNWGDQPADRTVRLRRPAALVDFWTGETVGKGEDEFVLRAMPGRSGRLLILK